MRLSRRSIVATTTLLSMIVVNTGALTALSAPITVGGPPQGPAYVPTGQVITATAAPGSTFYPLHTGLRPDTNADAAEAVTTALSPNGKKLLVLTSGYNKNFYTTTGTPITIPVLDPTTGTPSSTRVQQHEWVFVFDITAHLPRKVQQIPIPNTYHGLVWSDDDHFLVSAGIDDRIYAYKQTAGSFVPDAPFILLGHNSNQTAPLPNYDGGILHGTPADKASNGLITTGAVVAGIDVSRDGRKLFAANMENDSISVVDLKQHRKIGDTHFFLPGQLVPKGEFPYWVTVLPGGDGSARKVYVSSLRDDHVMSISPGGAVTYIRVGKGPNRMLLSKNYDRLYVANGDSDTISIIDTSRDVVLGHVTLLRRGDIYKGQSPNSLALSPDDRTLYVTLGGENAVAIIRTTDGAVLGRIPTGWSPNSVTVSADGKMLYVVNGKANVGPNPANTRTTPAGAASNPTHRNEYNWALEKAGLLAIPLPLSSSTLAALTAQVDRNNGYGTRQIPALMASLHTKIKHVIYIVNENRTYDQVLGDVAGTNAAPALNLFPYNVSPNHHHLATDFVTLDNFYDPGESSGVGWNWSMEAHDNDFTEKSQSVLYGNSSFNGLTYDYQGTNRNLNLGSPISASPPTFFSERLTSVLDPSGRSTILPGTEDVAAPENGDNESPNATGGYLWDTALRAGKTIRNYGWQIDQTAYESGTPLDPPLVRHPYEHHAPQSPPINRPLRANTDIYYRGFDQRYPDQFRIEDWLREFNGYVAHHNLPDLEMMTIPHDHFGSFNHAMEGLNTPTVQFADNDYAIGELVDAVSHSPYWKDTAIFIVEDDSQNGPDHVDGHRSIGYAISAYTRRHAVVHSLYTTINVLTTIEQILGLRAVSWFDANAAPMADVFTATADTTPYTQILPGVLCHPPVSPDFLPDQCKSASHVTSAVKTLHNGAWWAAHTTGFDFSRPDRIDSARFNSLLYDGIKGAAPRR